MKFEFKKVLCCEYLKKVYDGKYVQTHKTEFDDLLECSFENASDADNSINIDVYGEMEKTYYRIEKCNEFKGVIVGIKNIVTKGLIIVSDESDCYGREFTRIAKEPKEILECGIVYFGNNRKRYVPLEHIEYIKE